MINIDFKDRSLVIIMAQHSRLRKLHVSPVEGCDNLRLRVRNLQDVDNSQE